VRAKTKIAQRLVRVQSGNTGDVKFFENIGELRIHHGPGYRLYFVQRGKIFILLLCGGDKSTQKRDIERATRIAKETTDDT
jgi:putative addiction module killer protein